MIDYNEVLKDLKERRSELDAAIRAVTRIAGRPASALPAPPLRTTESPVASMHAALKLAEEAAEADSGSGLNATPVSA
jgi:hypothetical protein